MKKLISILLFCMFIFVLPQCNVDNKSNSNERNDSSPENQKENVELKTNQYQDLTDMNDKTKLLTFSQDQISKPEMIDSCLQFIRSHYKKQFYNAEYDAYYDNYHDHKLTLKKHKTHEDSLYFIVSFSERENYNETETKSYSSIIFKKEKGKFVQLLPDISENLTYLTYPSIDQLDYPGRVSGVPFLITDLTGDNKSDFMFRSESSFKLSASDDNSPSIEYFIYYQRDNTVKIVDLYCNGFENRSDTSYYKKEVNFTLLENSLGAPLLQFEVNYEKKNRQKKMENIVPVMRIISFYQWNKKTETFDRL